MSFFKKITSGEFRNKMLLMAEAPFLPFVYPFFAYMAQTPSRRKWLYLRTEHFFPLRRASFYVLDKLFEKECDHFKKPSYDGNAGYILDLKYALAHDYFNKKIYNNNYRHSLQHLREIVGEGKGDGYTIIDFGAGAGVMTRMVKAKYPLARVVGLDIRPEIASYNTIMYPEINWGHVKELLQYTTKDESKNTTILLCNGVINFMEEKELDALFEANPDYVVWFYYTSFLDPAKEYMREDLILKKKHNDVDYNMPKVAKNHHYTFSYVITPHQEGSGNFVHGVSRKMN